MRTLIYSAFLLLATTSTATPKGSIYDLNQTWTNDSAQPTPLSQFKGKPLIAALIFTSCPGICPMLITSIQKFDQKLTAKERTKSRYLLFSIDPETDKPEVLKKFKKKRSLDSRWTLLTAPADTVRELAVALGFSFRKNGKEDFTHSTNIYLISPKGEIAATLVDGGSRDTFFKKLRENLTPAP